MARTIDVTSLPWELRWVDVDPDAWPVGDDLHERAKALVIDVLMDTPRDEAPSPKPKKGKGKGKAQAARPTPSWRVAAEQGIARAFGQAFGPWAGGFRWARDEGSLGGGVIGSWCCPTHSVCPGQETALEPTALRAADALLEWRAWLTTLRAAFEATPPTGLRDADVTDDMPEAERERRSSIAMGFALDTACAELVALVVEQSSAGDAWYNHMAQVLAWYLEHHGANPVDAADAAEAAIAGRFESWSGPSEETLSNVRTDWTQVARRALRVQRPGG